MRNLALAFIFVLSALAQRSPDIWTNVNQTLMPVRLPATNISIANIQVATNAQVGILNALQDIRLNGISITSSIASSVWVDNAGTVQLITSATNVAMPSAVVSNYFTVSNLIASTGGGNTYVVAASNAPQGVKDHASYVCDGSHDQEQIQIALTAIASAGGGTLYLSEGTFSITTNALFGTKTAIIGSGRATILQAGTNLNGSVLASNGRVNNCFLKDFAIDGNQANQSTVGYGITYDGFFSVFDNLWITGVKSIAVYLPLTADGQNLFMGGRYSANTNAVWMNDDNEDWVFQGVTFVGGTETVVAHGGGGRFFECDFFNSTVCNIRAYAGVMFSNTRFSSAPIGVIGDATTNNLISWAGLNFDHCYWNDIDTNHIYITVTSPFQAYLVIDGMTEVSSSGVVQDIYLAGNGTVRLKAYMDLLDFAVFKEASVTMESTSFVFSPWSRATAPATTNVVLGAIYMDSGANTGSRNPGFRRYNGTAWVDTGAANGFSSISVTNTGSFDTLVVTNQASVGSLLINGGAANATPVDVKIYTTPGANTWTNISGAKAVQVLLIGGGAGGGSGRKGAAGSVRCGGGGGAGAAWTMGAFPASILGSTETVTVGTGGAGGAAQTADDSDGNNGTGGTATTFGSWASARNAGAGGGGTATGGTAGTVSAGVNNGGAGGAASGAGGTGANGGSANGFASGGGAAGGGISMGNSPADGGTGGNGSTARTTLPTGGTAGTGGANGGTGTSGTANVTHGGAGGGGGGASITTNAGRGGDGGTYGAGGGGGGAGLNATGDSGAGGNGANGIAIVITSF